MNVKQLTVARHYLASNELSVFATEYIKISTMECKVIEKERNASIRPGDKVSNLTILSIEKALKHKYAYLTLAINYRLQNSQ